MYAMSVCLSVCIRVCGSTAITAGAVKALGRFKTRRWTEYSFTMLYVLLEILPVGSDAFGAHLPSFPQSSLKVNCRKFSTAYLPSFPQSSLKVNWCLP